MPELSVVIAAYNEERRLPKTLDRLFAYLSARNITFEIVIVNDGSRDKTKEIVEQYVSKYKEIKLISHFPNRGRGASIREGVLASGGNIIVETDADSSTDMRMITKFLSVFKSWPELDAIFGSREMIGSVVPKAQPFLRVFLGYGFIYLTKFVLWMWSVSDFALGFKMFRRKAAMDIFKYQFDNHYVAEAEIVYVAYQRGWKFIQLPVDWSDDRDSRIQPLRDSIRSLMALIRLRMNGFRGVYRK